MIQAGCVSGRIHIKTPFDMKDRVKALPGARWSPPSKTWHIPATPHAALALLELGDVDCDPETMALVAAGRKAQDAVGVKTQTTGLFDVPTRTKAWTHQQQAFSFVVKAELKSAMLAMDMGTGKSLTAIGLLDAYDCRKVLILCPRNVMGVWPNQFRTHSNRPWHTVPATQRATAARRAQHIAREVALAEAKGAPVVVMVNYEAAWRPAMANYLLSQQWDYVVLDESHRIKAPGGKQSIFCHRLAPHADRRLCLTGTPMPHSPLDIYAQYRFLDEGIFGTSFNRFRNKYAIMGGYEGRQVIDYQDQDGLAEKFHSIAFVCSADDVLDLPEYQHVTRPFELENKSLKAYNAIDADFVLGVKDGTVTVTNALTKLLRLQQVTSGFIRDDEGNDHQIGTEKAEMLADVLCDIPETEPVVIFARFQHDLDVIAGVCEKLGRTHGELSGRSRSAITEDSKMAEWCDVAIVQEQAGGVGIDLTRAAYCVFYSLSFSLGDYEQALKRVHRPGQDRKTTYVHLVAQATKDEVVYEALAARKNVVEAVMNNIKEQA